MLKDQFEPYSWRTLRYQRFYQIADQVVDEVQDLVWADTGKAKRRVKGAPIISFPNIGSNDMEHINLTNWSNH